MGVGAESGRGLLLLGIAFGIWGEGGILVAICGAVSCFGSLFLGRFVLGFPSGWS